MFLSLVFLVSIFAVPVFAATTADSQASSLQSGWFSSSAPSGYSSWFWRVVSELDSMADDVYQISVDTNTIDGRLLTIDGVIDSIYSSLKLVSDNLIDVKSDVSSIDTKLISLGSDISSIAFDLGLVESDVDTIRSTTTTISSNLSDVKSKVTDIELNTDYLKTIDADTSTLLDHSTQLRNGSWMTSGGGNWYFILYNLLNRIVEVQADYDDLQINRSQTEEKNAVLSGIAKVDRVGNINDFSGLEGDLKDYFAMDDVDIGLMFGQVKSGYSSWFSMKTASALAVGGGVSAVSGAAAATYGLDRAAHEGPETPYLDAYAEEVASILAGGDNE